MSIRKPISGYRLADTRQGDTLQAIALRELGDASKWSDLAALNNLLPPYVVDTLAELEDDAGDPPPGRVLLVGMPIKIPAPGPAPSGVLDVSDLFGTDLDLSGGLLSVSEAGDLQLVSGVPNLRQALHHRLETHTGELIFHPDYGQRFHELIGGPANPITNLLGASYVASCVRSDPRIANVRDTKAELRGDGIAVSATAVTIDGKPLPVGGE
ncbi:conserved protein of unknown function (plasmid) [Rhodovastum atsumiense]|uniref:LysM peptidoglycan-binding domain-containing protein n=1 Tax=Rhodovastum atsumiense TaxID=504468 RepID=A0A5M6ITN1_9PROT|nr:hypothetical protein [Rhodovastum atsumiense]KAA5611571.1 hypothetical protein F1189_13485 [Rhodovastum atsumiense]CAH2606346.1 conserved protein of unknown function [Rhodovastum atsumiense]